MSPTHVHVIGTGTIGEPLVGLLCDFREELGIDEVSFHKRTPLLHDRPKVKDLIRRGAKLVADPERMDEFKEMGTEATFVHDDALYKADVVIDCTPAGNENKEKLFRRFESNTKGFLAQGSEFGFGKMYARGVNDQALVRGEDQYLQVVSCNTHNMAVLLHAIAYNDGEDYKNLDSAEFLCMRRANDISQDVKFSPSPTMGLHTDEKYGTHHARDAALLYQTIGVEPNIFSSAVKLNTQYMHAMWFHIRTHDEIDLEDIKKRLEENDRISLTVKRSANQVFSFGRDHGHFGRILNESVIPIETLTRRNSHEMIGFSFTPQDGNSLLTSVAATCWYLDPETYNQRIQCLKKFFFDEV